MPNWSYNEVFIDGAYEDLEAIRKQVERRFIWFDERENRVKIQTNRFSLHGIIPEPPEVFAQRRASCFPKDAKTEIEKLSFDYDNPANWYNWRNSHWGTKWDTRSAEVDLPEGSTTLSAFFDTAWCPPEPCFEELSRQYPNVTINLDCDVEGSGRWHVQWKAGQKMFDRQYLECEDILFNEERQDNLPAADRSIW